MEANINQMVDQYKERNAKPMPKGAKVRSFSNEEITQALHDISFRMGKHEQFIEDIQKILPAIITTKYDKKRGDDLQLSLTEMSIFIQGIVRALVVKGVISEDDYTDSVNICRANLQAEIEQRYDQKNGLTIVDRAIEKGDAALLKYDVKIKDENGNDVPQPQFGREKHFVNAVGSGEIVPEIEVELIGMKAGDTKTVSVKFDDNREKHHEFAGKEVVFDISVLSVKEHKNAEPSQELQQTAQP